MLGEYKMNLKEAQTKRDNLYQLWRSKLRLYQLWRPEVSSEDVQTAQMNYEQAEKDYQLARKEAGLTYVLKGE